MEIRIHIPRPGCTLFVLLTVFFWLTGPYGLGSDAAKNPEARGGNIPGVQIAQAQETITRQQLTQAVLSQREDILRYQVQVLEAEAALTRDPEKVQELSLHRKVLLDLVEKRTESERLLASSLSELWDAEGTDFSDKTSDHTLALQWPLEPLLGISAHFEDAAYKQRFGVPHHAIDIPVDQGTVIRAPADGTVVHVSLNGLGYSYVVLQHEGGVQTVYGHISSALVQQGDSVRAGSPIALSGGRPGSPGAGLLTTGPHLHFAVKQDGVLVDPEKYLVTGK